MFIGKLIDVPGCGARNFKMLFAIAEMLAYSENALNFYPHHHEQQLLEGYLVLRDALPPLLLVAPWRSSSAFSLLQGTLPLSTTRTTRSADNLIPMVFRSPKRNVLLLRHSGLNLRQCQSPVAVSYTDIHTPTSLRTSCLVLGISFITPKSNSSPRWEPLPRGYVHQFLGLLLDVIRRLFGPAHRHKFVLTSTITSARGHLYTATRRHAQSQVRPTEIGWLEVAQQLLLHALAPPIWWIQNVPRTWRERVSNSLWSI